METTEIRITIEGIRSITDIVDKQMKADKTYSYAEFWKEFVYPSELEAIEKNITFLNVTDRGQLKKGINDEFTLRGIPKILFSRRNIGFYMLDAETGVAAKKLLERVKKVASANDNLVEQCSALADANGLSNKDERLLKNVAMRFDDNKSALAGTIGRMTSIPSPVKMEMMRTLGLYFDEEEE